MFCLSHTQLQQAIDCDYNFLSDTLSRVRSFRLCLIITSRAAALHLKSDLTSRKGKLQAVINFSPGSPPFKVKGCLVVCNLLRHNYVQRLFVTSGYLWEINDMLLDCAEP